jgi:CheY-specific phosphatase CheX
MNFERAFTDAFLEVVLTSAGTSFQVLSSESDMSFAEITGVMNLNGDKQRILFISADTASVKTLFSRMTATPKDTITQDDIYDTLCELVNMTAGNAKLRLGDERLILSAPFILRGENMMIIPKRKVRVLTWAIGDNDITFQLKVML